ncbi:Cell growth regulator with RING finger domain protein 1 [Halotydeus destructor]|nr:Cell growth regulator with RING finger domain protein 1 [Halotydeus destructor]
MMPIWLPLWQLIEVSNGFAILFIIVCLFTMIAFILRVKPENMDGSSVVMMRHQPEEVRLQYQACPFRALLRDADGDHKQTYGDGISLEICCTRSYWFAYYWGCDITLFHQTMQMDWKDMKKVMLDGIIFGDVAARSEPQLLYEKEREITLKPPEGFSHDDLGDPRSRFPLVLAFFINEDDLDGELAQNDTVGLVSAIHIRDPIATMETNFVYKLTKLANGQVLNVTNLYTKFEEEEHSDCVICLTAPVEVGLLPCRHYCVCESCFTKLPDMKQCPICRSLVSRFFRHKLISPLELPPPVIQPSVLESVPCETTELVEDTSAPLVQQTNTSRSPLKWVSNKFNRWLNSVVH